MKWLIILVINFLVTFHMAYQSGIPKQWLACVFAALVTGFVAGGEFYKRFIAERDK